MISHQVSVEEVHKEDASFIQKRRASMLRKQAEPTMRITDEESALTVQVMATWNTFASRVQRVSPKSSP